MSMTKRMNRWSWLVGFLSAGGAQAAEFPPAGDLLHQTGVRAGLAVVVGTTDGALEADLTNDGKVLVHGLALSDEAAVKARKHIVDKKLYGLASVSRVQSAATLPYYDRIVNLLVADLDALGKDTPTKDEIERVLGYEGVAYLKQGGKWVKTVKPTPKDVDTWTHTLHDVSRTSVSADRVAAPPNAVRWMAPPMGSIRGGVRTTNGTFVLLRPAVPHTARGARNPLLLAARDVNSGVLLWTHEVSSHDKGYPGDGFNETFVAAEGRAYCYRYRSAEDKFMILTGFNIRTGKVEMDFDKTVRLDAADSRQLRYFTGTETTYHPWKVPQVAVHQGKVIQTWKEHLLVSDANTGKILWQKQAPADNWWRWFLAAEENLIILRGDASADGKVTGPHPGVITTAVRGIDCMRLADGGAVWTLADLGPNLKTVQGLGPCSKGLLPVAGWNEKWRGIVMLDARAGKRLWEITSGYVAGESYPIILGDEMWLSSQKGGESVDLATGKPKRKFSIPHHQTCGNNCATPNYFLFLKLFVPLDQPPPPSGKGSYSRFYVNRSLQNQCRYIVSPSYGSIYRTDQVCQCEAFLPGSSAYYTVALTPFAPDADRLQAKGCASLGEMAPQAAARASFVATDWGKPKNAGDHWLLSYRQVHMKWSSPPAPVWRNYEPDQTEPVTAGDLTLVAHVQEHRLAASRGGKEVWNFVAGGRITTAPAVHNNLALFGSHDGYVYAVNIADGAPVWRFLAAPADKRHVVFGQVESAWPVFNVLIHEGKAYFAAGRHPELEGGLHFYCLDPAGGKIQWHVKYLRGLSTEKFTPERPASGSGWAARGAGPDNIPNRDASWIIADPIAIKENKIWMRLFPVVDLANPKDTIINAETLVPPGRSSDTGQVGTPK
jgi:outer membrane protein assembly factor BamB